MDLLLLAQAVDPVKGLTLAHRIPLRLHNIGPRSGRDIQPDPTTGDGGQEDGDSRVLTEDTEHAGPAGGCEAAVQPDAAD